jgi:hypothetical protein
VFFDYNPKISTVLVKKMQHCTDSHCTCNTNPTNVNYKMILLRFVWNIDSFDANTEILFLAIDASLVWHFYSLATWQQAKYLFIL